MIYRTHNLTGCLVVLQSKASMRRFLGSYPPHSGYAYPLCGGWVGAHAHLLTEKEEKWMGPESGVVRVNIGGNITNLPVHFSQEDMVWKFYYTTKAPQEAVAGN